MPKRKRGSAYSGSPRKSPRKSGGNASAAAGDDGVKEDDKERPPNVTFQFEDEDEDGEMTLMELEWNPLDAMVCLSIKEESANENQVPCEPATQEADNLSNRCCLPMGSSPYKRASPLSPTLLDNVPPQPPVSSLPVPSSDQAVVSDQDESVVPKAEEDSQPVPMEIDDSPIIKRRLLNGHCTTANSVSDMSETSQTAVPPPTIVKDEEKLKLVSEQSTKKITSPSQSQFSKTSKTPSATPQPPPTAPAAPQVDLPKAVFRIIEDYSVPDKFVMDKENYLKWVPKFKVDMCIEVTYELDEMDMAWLDIMNKKRKKYFGLNLGPVKYEELELLMDRLEKEHYYTLQNNGMGQPEESDEDAVCCVCFDGESDNSNQIIFCDMCNIPVHQDCYGVPFIPEGSWLCRRCSISPNAEIECIFCPNKDGAFKQTVDGRWAHVHCAMWIPEVRFSNASLVEPIDDICDIPPGRWKLVCFICKKKGVGACIQCHLRSCVAAFHPSCAQREGLSMKMELKPKFRMSASCDKHTTEKTREALKEKIATINKVLNEKKFDQFPSIPQERIEAITNLVSFVGRTAFVKRVVAYWKLKRKFRGAPLLRNLEAFYIPNEPHPYAPPPMPSEEDPNLKIACVKNMKNSRDELEQYKKFAELIKTHAVATRQYLELYENIHDLQMKHLDPNYIQVIKKLKIKDKKNIFSEPVTEEEAPEYSSIISKPMDLSTMEKKVYGLEYTCLEDIEADFMLIIENCMTYNKKSTVFYRYALKMKEDGEKVFDETRAEIQRQLEAEERRKTEASEERQQLRSLMLSLLDKLAKYDKHEIFKDPVDPEVVPDYETIVKEPMDFSTMRGKVEDGSYPGLEDLESDYNLMLDNCMAFNEDDTDYFKIARRMKDLGSRIFLAAKKDGKVCSPSPKKKSPRKSYKNTDADRTDDEDDEDDEDNNNNEDKQEEESVSYEDYLKKLMDKVLHQLIDEDDNGVFLEPVDLEEYDDYLDEVDTPMDFSLMEKKFVDGDYTCLEDLEKDYNLMLANCKKYNGRGSVFYGIAVEMKKAGDFHFRNGRKELKKKFKDRTFPSRKSSTN